DSNVYFVQQNGTQIGRLSTTNPNAVGVELALAQGWTASGLTTFNNLVYVAENAATGSKVVELTPSGTVSHEWTISSSNIGLGPIVVGSSQFLYYTEFSGGALRIGQLNLQNGTTDDLSAGSTSQAADITVAGGNVYFTEPAPLN